MGLLRPKVTEEDSEGGQSKVGRPRLLLRDALSREVKLELVCSKVGALVRKALCGRDSPPKEWFGLQGD